MKDDWRSITMGFGEQSVMIYSTPVMLRLSAIVLDSGLLCIMNPLVLQE